MEPYAILTRQLGDRALLWDACGVRNRKSMDDSSYETDKRMT